MTIPMPDSTNPASLPPSYPAYLGYIDGQWATAPVLAAKFPDAHRLILTVTGYTTACDGVDVEPDGNPNAQQGADWVRRKLAAAPGFRPVVYASVQGTPGYGMPDVLAELGRLGIDRARTRLLSAHYTNTPHICGPASCGEIGIMMDGTQWTCNYPGLGGGAIDMSALANNFFGPDVPAWQEDLMQALPTLRPGATGEFVKTVQGLCAARGHAVAVDGAFGPATEAAVRAVQEAAHIAQDGEVGAQTWVALMGV